MRLCRPPQTSNAYCAPRVCVLASSRALWRYVDDGLIDGTVNGAGRVSAIVGWFGAKVQTGQLNTYAFAVVVGVLLLLGLVAF